MSYQYNATVNKTEADALKEMIFKRVRERAQAMTDDVQTDVMDIARESFTSNNNPFSQIVANSEPTNVSNSANSNKNTIAPAISTDKNDTSTVVDGIGFPQRKVQIQQSSEIANEQTIISTINNNMIEARASLNNKTSFMGALNFLISQSAVSIFRDNDNKFNAIA